MLRQHLWLLSGPWLAASAVVFGIGTTVRRVTDQVFPRIDSQTLHAARVAGKAGLPIVLAGLRISTIRMVISTGDQVIQYLLQACALALMVVLVAQLAAGGECTLRSGFERLRKVPALASAVLRFAAIILGIGLVIGMAVVAAAVFASLCFAVIAIRGNVHGPHAAPPIPPGMFIVVIVPAAAAFVYYVVPYLLSFVFAVQGRPTPRELVKKPMISRARRYAALTVAASGVLGLSMFFIQRYLAANSVIHNALSLNIERLAANLLTSIPTVPFIVAIALMTMSSEIPVTEAEPV